MLELFIALVWAAAVLALFVVLARKIRRRTHRFGPGAIGSVYELLNEERRNAVEIIVEQRAEERDPEDKDGDLPQLEDPKPR